MKNLILLSALALGGCGPSETSDVSYNLTETCSEADVPFDTDPEFQGFVKGFYVDAMAHSEKFCIVLASVKFGTDAPLGKADNGDIIGLCDDQHNVRIWRPWWNQASEIAKEAVIYHELGHCVLGLEHAKQDTLNFMTPEIPGDYDLLENWNLLVTKLFNKDMSLQD